MKERPDFEKEIKNELKQRKEEASNLERVNAKVKRQKKAPDDKLEKPVSNKGFISFWKNRTIEEEIDAQADNFDCANCPLVTCEFEGEKIARDIVIDNAVRDKAYKNMTPEEMHEYANELEGELERLRKEGYMEKPSYDEYVRDYGNISEQDYRLILHPREKTLRDAIHWLRLWAMCGVPKIS